MMHELLPIGSIVRLNTFLHKVMIIGYGPISSAQSHKEYLGVNYPYGLSSRSKTIMFDSTLIEELIHVGYADEETKQGYKALSKLILK